MINVQIKGGALSKAFNAGASVLEKTREKITQQATKTILKNARVYITDTKAIDTGFLRGPGMKDTRLSPGKRKLENTAPYSLFIHEGTSKMKKRPFFDQAIRRSRNEINHFIKNIVEQTTLTITKK